MTTWKIFTGKPRKEPTDEEFGVAPPWRPTRGIVPPAEAVTPPPSSRTTDTSNRGSTFRVDDATVNLVNAALHLRRPLLITGKPGTGKSSLIYAVAAELGLGPVLRWSVTSRSTLQQGLYQYDAIGRFHALDEHSARPPVGDFVTLGPLGTALLPTNRPRALLIDEIDKSDIDLPNDLLNIFEEGEYFIPELQRLKQETPVDVTTADGARFPITNGHVRCNQFPFVVLTSNGEREFPPPFLRRCLRLDMKEPNDEQLAAIVRSHLGAEAAEQAAPIIETFLKRRQESTLATDQLLNAVFLLKETDLSEEAHKELVTVLLRALSTSTVEKQA